MNTDIHTLGLTLMCARCEARPGEPCKTLTGHNTSPHAARLESLYQAYAGGYEDGRHDEADPSLAKPGATP